MKNFDNKLATILITLFANRIFDQVFYLSMQERDQVRKEYGRLPNKLAGPTNYSMSSQILDTLFDGDFYMDGSTLVNGDKSVMEITKNTTWANVSKQLENGTN